MLFIGCLAGKTDGKYWYSENKSVKTVYITKVRGKKTKIALTYVKKPLSIEIYDSKWR